MNEYKLDASYEVLRSNMEFPDATHKFNQIGHAVTKYETIFHNNLWMHAWTRLREYLLHKTKGMDIGAREVYSTLQHPFVKDKSSAGNHQLIQWMIEDLNYDGQGLYDICTKSKYCRYIKLFYDLQRYNNRNELKNFALVPILKHGRHHVTIDTRALSNILSSLREKPENKPFIDQDWSKYFKYEDLERGKKFRGSVSADGVSISFSIEHNTRTNEQKTRKKAKFDNNTLSSDSNLANIRENKDTYQKFIGLDPGLRLMCGGVVKQRDQLKTREGDLIKIKSSHFIHLTGAHVRDQKLKKWTHDIEEKSNSTLSPMDDDYLLYTKHRLPRFDEKQRVYEQQKVARLKFDKNRRTEPAAHKLARKIIGNDGAKTIINIGSSSIAANSPMRGYVRTPQPKLLTALKARADVLQINEFRTTKLCSTCLVPVKTSNQRHRYQFCQKCGICYNRDVNAGINILNVGWQHHVLGEPLPKAFLR